MMTGIITALIVVGATGLLIGLFLGVAGEKLKVEVDEREELITGLLPGNNCGGCGFPGCSGLAAAIVKGEAAVSGCPVGGAAVAEKIAEVMGVAAGDSVPMTAFVKCQGDCDKALQSYEFIGDKSCTMQKYMPSGGSKMCTHGCLGGGDCVKACQFGAISIVNGIAKVDEAKCKACSKCVAACPRNLIELIPANAAYRAACSSTDRGAVAAKTCKNACMGCTICQRNCPEKAVTVENNLAHIDYEKCVECGLCESKCPKKVIKNYTRKESD